MTYDLKGQRIWVAGHHGMVGSAVVRRLATEDCVILTAARDKLDLTQQSAVQDWVAQARPDVIVMAAAKVGGILANATYPADFMVENMQIQTNIFQAAHLLGVSRVLFLGSSCIYPKWADQPITEESLLTGSLEPTNEGYALAKIAGIKMCQSYRKQYGHDWISAMPTNLYGPGDNYDLQSSHVLPALLRKFHTAKTEKTPCLTVWGSGTPLREFLHADDLADALIFLLKHFSDDIQINVGSGVEITIRDLAELISDIVGYGARLDYDMTKPDGTPRKLMDSSRLTRLGWNGARPLRDGITATYRDLLRSGVLTEI